MELKAEVWPNDIPKMKATRSKSARPTSPQFRAPTTTRIAATTSRVLIFVLLLVEVASRTVSGLFTMTKNLFTSSQSSAILETRVNAEKKGVVFLTPKKTGEERCCQRHCGTG